tara:strand:- start:30542 stop:30733 length:192 start_codon:yes stop_codon:yes gene_type:complete
LIEFNVQKQCVHVIKIACVQKAYRERGITLSGWVFDIHRDALIDLKLDFNKILENIRNIYRFE